MTTPLLLRAMPDFKYTCPDCDNDYTDPGDVFRWTESGRERNRCVYCNRFKKRVYDCLRKVPEAVRDSFKKLSSAQKKEYKKTNLLVTIEDLPASMEAYVEEARV